MSDNRGPAPAAVSVPLRGDDVHPGLARASNPPAALPRARRGARAGLSLHVPMTCPTVQLYLREEPADPTDRPRSHRRLLG
jgi:hypothetical protein